MPRRSRPLHVLLLVVGLGAGGVSAQVSTKETRTAAGARVVYVVGKLPEVDLLVFLSAAAAAEPAPPVLMDTPTTAPHLAAFVRAYRPDRVVQVTKAETHWETLLPRVDRVVVCPAEPRELLLHAACLAGAARAPLLVPRQAEDLERPLSRWKPSEIMVVGGASSFVSKREGAAMTMLADISAVAAAARRLQQARGPLQALLVANPADGAGLATLAPWLAVQRGAALLLTNAAGDNVATVVREALKDPALRQADALVLVGDARAIPMERRPNPAAGKDTNIEMEPLTPEVPEAFTFATGRLFHRDRGMILLTEARQRLLVAARGPRNALIASNPGGSLPLLEMFSRHTAQEIRNAGYETTALFGRGLRKDDLRRRLPEQDIFLWEGHYKTMVDNYRLPFWTEPLRPSLVFLQSCLALNAAEAQPLVERGAVAVVGSSTRIYSATGGAFTLAYFDALLYDSQSLGGALRQAKNFLLAYALLKEKRLGENARLGGASIRSAWAFTLWGDPLLKLPAPERPNDALAPARHVVRGQTIVLERPEGRYDSVATDQYQVRAWPNARLAGLVTRGEDDDKQLVPLQFAEIPLKPPAAGKAPRLKTKVPEKSWVFIWDGRREVGYLLVVPPKAQRALQFEVQWE